MLSQPSPPTPDRIPHRGGVTIQNDSGEDEMTERCTSRPRSEGSSLGSSVRCSTPRKRKRSIGKEREPWSIAITQSLTNNCIRCPYPRMAPQGSDGGSRESNYFAL
jgi:hypothetical protein